MSKETPDFLLEKKAEDENFDLLKLTEMVGHMLQLEEDLKEREEKTKELQAIWNELNQTKIPEFMKAAGLKKIQLDSGETVIVKSDISITIKDKSVFYEFLGRRNESEIIKTKFNFDKMNDDRLLQLYEYLLDNEYEYEAEKSVHAATAKSYFKNLLGLNLNEAAYKRGLDAGRVLKQDDIKDVAKIFEYYKTQIKK